MTGAPGVFFHTSYVVADLKASQHELTETLGLEFTPVQELSMDVSDWRGPFGFPNCFVMSYDPNHPVELIPARRGTVFESEKSFAFHHIGYWVDDLQGEIDKLVAAGLELEMWGNGEGPGPSQFAFLRYRSGLRIELVDTALRAGFEHILAARTSLAAHLHCVYAGGPLGPTQLPKVWGQ